MPEPTPSQLAWAREKLSSYPDPLTPRDLADTLGDESTTYVLAAMKHGTLNHIEKRSGPRVRYAIYKEDAVPFLASHRRQAPEEKQ